MKRLLTGKLVKVNDDDTVDLEYLNKITINLGIDELQRLMNLKEKKER